jgi:hypothetical protein
MKRPRRSSWTGLVTFLLVVSLFVPVEGSTPCLTPEGTGAPEQRIEHASCSSLEIGTTSWGECNDVNCCGGQEEAPCKPAAL